MAWATAVLSRQKRIASLASLLKSEGSTSSRPKSREELLAEREELEGKLGRPGKKP